MKLTALIPKPLRERVVRSLSRLRSRREFSRDADRYLRWMLTEDRSAHVGLSGRNLEAQITKDYHRIEKGLALATPRKPFGAEVERRLRLLLPHSDPSAAYTENAASALAALTEWNSTGTVSDEVSPVRDERPSFEGFESLFLTRASTRDFSDIPVPDDLLHRAVELAATTPSVCNRQSWQVRFFAGSHVRALLKHQNGNAGFGESVPAAALVSVDLRDFAGPGERNQAWIEGGLFSMSLVLALHGLGLDTCMLNLSVTNDRSDRLRLDLGVPDYEVPIMMIAVGYGRPGHRRARSPRRASSQIIRQAEPGRPR